ncbi:hypothetical protein B0H17DRAFT_1128723 [Mycena rosella]|uniref:Uncharacterized protein n=1 Tax=Mycena rosella TaxID=1033263 RepID=A0AAD7GLY4_MYCRO|nr:hypothetical protein B0H17DRAFT_1128723 [Mycena rosella]
MADLTTRTSALLSHRNVEVWISDRDGHRIPHGPVIVTGNEISTSVDLPKEHSPGITQTALCQIFIPHLGTYWKVGNYFMDKEKPETQWKSSEGQLSPPFQNGVACFVALEVRRGNGTQVQECEDSVDESCIDLIDDLDEVPHIVFRFDFLEAKESPSVLKKLIAGDFTRYQFRRNERL